MTTTSCSISQPELDSFYAAMQRRRLLARMFDQPDEELRYEILGEIGRGGMGIVYEAYHHRLERTVAIKRVRDRGDAKLQQHLVDEAKAMARLTHPNIVTVFDIEEAEGTTLIVMEYVDGVTLKHWLHHDRPAADAIVAAFLDAGEGLIAAHAKGLIHGDFKPSNVMLDGEGRVRVMDFGLARMAGSSHPESFGLRGGTPTYMAPEQLAGTPADARCDQFAFCASLHAALWGKDVSRPIDDLPELARIVRRGLHPDPRQRHPSMRTLVDALRGELRRRRDDGRHEAGADEVTPDRSTLPGVAGRGWTLGLLCLLAAGLALLVYAERSVWTPVIIPGLSMFVSRSQSVQAPGA